MNITIVAVGKKRTEHFESALAEYEKRLTRWITVKWHIIPSSNDITESQQLLKLADQAKADSVTILLDERGEAWSTPDLAAHISTWQNQSVKNVLFIIGGSHGVSNELRDQVTHAWSLSSLVFPHELVRVLVIEQLYRAYDLNAGGGYHHG